MKIKREAKAFAMRVKMSQHRLWLIVEGRTHDRAFYDRVLEDYPGTAEGGYSIRLAEEISLAGASAGGKPFAIRLYDFFRNSNILVQKVEDLPPRVIAFAFDKDMDELGGRSKSDPHILYTAGMDVEADILRHTDIYRTIAATFSLPVPAVRARLQSASDVFDDLATIWRDWITVGAACRCVNAGVAGSTRFSLPSEFNDGTFGPVDTTRVDAALASIRTRLSDQEAMDRLDALMEEIQEIFTSNQGWRLVKGRWAAKYISHLLKDAFPDTEIDARATPGTMAKVGIVALPSGGAWARHYWKRLDVLQARAG